MLWEHEVVGSIPTTPTNFLLSSDSHEACPVLCV